MKHRRFVLAAGACLLAFIAAACGGGGQDQASERTADTGQPPTQETATQVDTAVDASPQDEAPPPESATGDDAQADEQTEPPAQRTDATTPSETPADEVPEPASKPETDTDLLINPDQIPQPDPSLTVTDIPSRPDAFIEYGSTLLPWLHGRTTINALIPLSREWGLPAVAGGDRWNLVDTNRDALEPGDGRSSIVLVFTDPATFGADTVGANLVVYDPLPDNPGQYRLACDHNRVKQLHGESA